MKRGRPRARLTERRMIRLSDRELAAWDAAAAAADRSFSNLVRQIVNAALGVDPEK